MKRLLCFLTFFSISLFLFSDLHLHAHALSGGRLMDTTEALQVFGSTFEITYYNGSDYVSSTATYTGGTRTLQDSVGQYPAGAECLQYTAPVTNLSINPAYITLQINPQYSIFDTTQLHTAIFVYSTSSAACPPYQTPDWRWTISGSESIFYGELDSEYNIKSADVGSDRCFYIPVDFSQQSTFAASSVRCTFCAPVSVYNGYLYFYIAPPYLSSDAFGQNGSTSSVTTVSTSSSSGSGGQSVDMTQTNGILSAIQSGINGLAQAILDGLAYLFVPREGYFDGLINQLRARFSWYTSIENAFNALYTSFSNTNFDSPPNLSVHGDGRTFFGTSIGTFDASAFVLDWFSSNRSTARAIQSSFMWLFFLLRTYKHLPSILAGNSTGDGDGGGDDE